MQPYDMVSYDGKLYCVHSFKMNREYVVLSAMNPEDDDYATIHIKNLTELGMTITDIHGCKTLDDVKKIYPEYMI